MVYDLLASRGRDIFERQGLLNDTQFRQFNWRYMNLSPSPGLAGAATRPLATARLVRLGCAASLGCYFGG